MEQFNLFFKTQFLSFLKLPIHVFLKWEGFVEEHYINMWKHFKRKGKNFKRKGHLSIFTNFTDLLSWTDAVEVRSPDRSSHVKNSLERHTSYRDTGMKSRGTTL